MPQEVAPVVVGVPAAPAGGLTERIPMSQTRKAIARNMEASWTIPRASHMDLANATYLYNLTEKEKDSVKKDLNIKLSFLPFMIKAAIITIMLTRRYTSGSLRR